MIIVGITEEIVKMTKENNGIIATKMEVAAGVFSWEYRIK